MALSGTHRTAGLDPQSKEIRCNERGDSFAGAFHLQGSINDTTIGVTPKGCC